MIFVYGGVNMILSVIDVEMSVDVFIGVDFVVV